MAGLTVEQDMRVRSALADLHDRYFTRDMKVTLVARHPTNTECFLVCGDDDLGAVVAMLQSKITPAADVAKPTPPCRACGTTAEVICYSEANPQTAVCPDCCDTAEHADGETGHQFTHDPSERDWVCNYCGICRRFTRHADND